MKIECMARVDETLSPRFNYLVVDVFGHQVTVATVPKEILMTLELAKLISEEWAKPKYSINHPVSSIVVRRLATTATAHLDTQ